jgi:hypothetical protein
MVADSSTYSKNHTAGTTEYHATLKKKKELHIMLSQCKKGKTCITSQGKLGKLLIQMVNVLYINDISLHNHNSYNHV